MKKRMNSDLQDEIFEYLVGSLRIKGRNIDDCQMEAVGEIQKITPRAVNCKNASRRLSEFVINNVPTDITNGDLSWALFNYNQRRGRMLVEEGDKAVREHYTYVKGENVYRYQMILLDKTLFVSAYRQKSKELVRKLLESGVER